MAPDAPNNASFSFFLYLCILVSFMLSVNAFSFRLIHRDSVHSPLFPGRNLSDTEILQRGIEISRARMSYLASMISKATNGSIHPDGLTPPIRNQDFLYMVEVGFGSPTKSQFLILDTGSRVIWIQCQPCIRCFPQAYPIFDPTQSSTYRKIPCSHPLCRPPVFSCSGDDCVYQITYGTPSTTKGVFSSETISSWSTGQSVQIVSGVAFGCSNDNVDFPFDDSNQLAGILGLGFGSQSLWSQLGRTARGRFSYCLQGFRSQLHSYLRFGSDAFINGQYQVTPLLRYGENTHYYLYLDDISIGHHRMAFPPGLFAKEPDGSGGIIIDSGSTISWIHPFAYGKIEEVFKRYFAQYGLERYYGAAHGLTLCYVYRADMTNYPSMTYHLKDADLVIPPENVFYISPQEGYFCYATRPLAAFSVVGAWQQHNMKFVFDAENTVLLFAPEDCSINP